jgi:hypothetical protein
LVVVGGGVPCERGHREVAVSDEHRGVAVPDEHRGVAMPDGGSAEATPGALWCIYGERVIYCMCPWYVAFRLLA